MLDVLRPPGRCVKRLWPSKPRYLLVTRAVSIRTRPKDGGSGTDNVRSASAGADARNQVNTLRFFLMPRGDWPGVSLDEQQHPCGYAFPGPILNENGQRATASDL